MGDLGVLGWLLLDFSSAKGLRVGHQAGGWTAQADGLCRRLSTHVTYSLSKKQQKLCL